MPFPFKAALLLCLGAAPSWAAVHLRGLIHDEKGRVVPFAEVSLRTAQRTWRTTSDQNGCFAFFALGHGPARLRVNEDEYYPNAGLMLVEPEGSYLIEVEMHSPAPEGWSGRMKVWGPEGMYSEQTMGSYTLRPGGRTFGRTIRPSEVASIPAD